MNSNLDNNSDDLYSSLMNLLIKYSGVQSTQSNFDGGIQANLEIDELDPLDLEEFNFQPESLPKPDADNLDAIGSVDLEEIELDAPQVSYNFGEIPTVQNRFQALLKRRLQTEIELHPPLFPWETTISDYESDIYDHILDSRVPVLQFPWTAHLTSFLPVSLPENVLVQLLEACTQAVQSPLKQGAKMVQAVKTLFPDRSQSLNELAGLVLLYPTRSSAKTQQLFTNRYDAATDTQKMALSLLAAKEIINALTLSVSPNQPSLERQWETSLGVITLKVEYQIQNTLPKLRIESRLPRGGSLTLQTNQGSAVAERTYPGYLSVESFDLQFNQNYPLEIQFKELDQKPLTFAINIASSN